jgi:hypothetical protein
VAIASCSVEVPVAERKGALKGSLEEFEREGIMAELVH